MKAKTINELTRQRNEIHEWLINSGAWKHHNKMYQWVEQAWQRYVNNIEQHAGMKLVEQHFRSAFANIKFESSIYNK